MLTILLLWLIFQAGAIAGYMIAMSSWGRPRRRLTPPKLRIYTQNRPKLSAQDAA